MPTYAESAATRDRAARKAAQDRYLNTTQAAFDADVRANTDKRGGWKRMRWERVRFSVPTASDAYRAGYDRVFGKGT